MSGFEVIEGGLWSPPPPPPPPTPVAGSEKRLVCGGISYSITHVIFNAKTVENLPSRMHYHGSCNKRNFVSPSDHVMFYLLYKHQ